MPHFEVYRYERETTQRRQATYIAKESESGIMMANEDAIIVEIVAAEPTRPSSEALLK